MISELWRQFEGQSIDKTLQLTRLIGTGGFGGVFLADHLVEGRFVRRVAVKLIESQPESFERQLAELITATTLQHPNILRCFHAGSVTFGSVKLLYLVMEIGEESLAARFDKTLLTVPEATILTRDVGSALIFLHQQKLVHRDLKPGNIMRVGKAWKLADFGTLRQSASDATSLTRAITGTIAYMPPESFDGMVSPAWDIWSLGVLILQAFGGTTPFGNLTEHRLMRAILTELPVLPGNLPVPFGDIVLGCLTKDHRERWSAQRVIETLRLDCLQEERGVTATAPLGSGVNWPMPESLSGLRPPFQNTVLESQRDPGSSTAKGHPRTISEVQPVARQRKWNHWLVISAIAAIATFIGIGVYRSQQASRSQVITKPQTQDSTADKAGRTPWPSTVMLNPYQAVVEPDSAYFSFPLPPENTNYFWGSGGAYYTLHAEVARCSVGFFLGSPMGASFGEQGDVHKLLSAGGYSLFGPTPVERPSKYARVAIPVKPITEGVSIEGRVARSVLTIRVSGANAMKVLFGSRPNSCLMVSELLKKQSRGVKIEYRTLVPNTESSEAELALQKKVLGRWYPNFGFIPMAGISAYEFRPGGVARIVSYGPDGSILRDEIGTWTLNGKELIVDHNHYMIEGITQSELRVSQGGWNGTYRRRPDTYRPFR